MAKLHEQQINVRHALTWSISSAGFSAATWAWDKLMSDLSPDILSGILLVGAVISLWGPLAWLSRKVPWLAWLNRGIFKFGGKRHNDAKVFISSNKPDYRFEEIQQLLNCSIEDIIRLVEWLGVEPTMPAHGVERPTKDGVNDRDKSGHWTISPTELLQLYYGEHPTLTFTGNCKSTGFETTVTWRKDNIKSASIQTKDVKEMAVVWQQWSKPPNEDDHDFISMRDAAIEAYATLDGTDIVATATNEDSSEKTLDYMAMVLQSYELPIWFKDPISSVWKTHPTNVFIDRTFSGGARNLRALWGAQKESSEELAVNRHALKATLSRIKATAIRI